MADHATPTKADGHGDGHAHAHGPGRYFVVWVLLLAFTALTVYTGHYHPNIVLALVIAGIKATLVVLFFMHMTEAPTANRIVFVTSIVFALVLIIGVFGDLWTRNTMSLPSAVPSTEGPEIQVQNQPNEGGPGHHVAPKGE